MAWNECGLTHLNLAQLIHDPALPYKSRKCFEEAEAKVGEGNYFGMLTSLLQLSLLPFFDG